MQMSCFVVMWKVDRNNEVRLACIGRDRFSTQQPVVEGKEVLTGCSQSAYSYKSGLIQEL